ncbi:MAG: glycosyltransferase family 87 protein [Candidatus Dormiibacterota bacterium]
MRTRLLPRSAVLGGVAGGLALAISNVIIWITRGPLGLLNDFYVYWSAAAVLNQGGNPYDGTALARVHDAAGVPGLLGGGYSYPLLFAQVLRPLALLPAPAAGAIFMVLSVLAVALAVAVLLGSAPRLSVAAAIPIGMLGGLFPPVSYGLWNGQANDILLPFLALAFRGLEPGANLALATAVKLYPATGFLALLGRRDWLRQVGLAAVLIGVPFAAAEVAVPGGTGSAGARVAGLLAPDPYWSNESINGFLSRLAIAPGPLRGLPVVPVDLVLIGALAATTVAVLWRCRFRPWEGALSLSIWLGCVAAPKNSLWNFAPMLLCLAYGVLRMRSQPRLALALLLAPWLMGLQLLLWAVNFENGTVPDSAYANPAVVWLTSAVGLYTGLMVGFVNARLLLLERPAPATAKNLAAAATAGP